jgi:hypothetical protein
MPTSSVFPSIDTDGIAKDLRLEKKGQSLGEKNQPDTDNEALDATENEIIERVGLERKRGLEEYEEHLGAYSQRLAQASSSRIGIEKAVGRATTNFEAMVSVWKNNLINHRDRVRERSLEKDKFRANNNLSHRTAHDRWPVLFSLALLALALLLEAVFNGYFFAQRNALGFLGGALVAVIVSFVNVSWSAVSGYLSRNLSHVAFLKKIAGLLVFVGWAVFFVCFNLAVAHFRDSLEGLAWQEATQRALTKFISSPIGLASIESWLLVAMGVFISVLAFWKGYRLDDPYPDYGRVWRQHEEAREHYAAEFSQAQENLAVMRDEAADELEAAAHGAKASIDDAVEVLFARRGLQAHLTNFLDHCDQSTNRLLSIYRDANRLSRSDAAPKHFSKEFRFERTDAPHFGGDPKQRDAALKETKRIQKIVEGGINRIFNSCSEAIKAFDEIEAIEDSKRPSQ